MAYDGRILHQAQMQFEADRARRAELQKKQREKLYRRAPRLREIEEQLRDTMRRLAVAAFRQGDDVRREIEALKQENLQLQEERRTILLSLKLPPDVLEEKPACPLCKDSGYYKGQVCQCLRKYYVRLQNQKLSSMLDVGTQSFDSFSLDWYSEEVDDKIGVSPRRNMERVYDICKDYALRFHQHHDNLLLYGAPGLGKTFLSACIARVVSNGGCSVVYDSAGQIFNRMEDQKFGREEQEENNMVHRILTCDLLILDDLGTEMTTNFVVSALYQIINTRLLREKSTVLNTNLIPSEWSRRYSPQIASRLEGEYQILPFFGTDIRRLKKLKMG